MSPRILSGPFAILFACSPVLAQVPAAAPVEAELPWPAELAIPPSPSLSPEEALKTFQLAPGFRAELVAADPMIGEPVAMSFDGDGRIWVVEMRGYMKDIDGKGEDEPNGRIVILEDTDGDGRMDKDTVFLDGLVMPRAIMLRKGGAVIAEPPALYWCPDENGDGKADSKTPIHASYCGTANPEHLPNGLMPALDNWIYNAKSTERFRFTAAGEFKRDRTAFRGQWGLSQDDWGRIFYNYNSDQLRADLLPSQYLSRNTHFKSAEGVNVQVARDQHVFPIRVTPGVNRAYRKGMLKDGKLVEFTAASGPVVYRGDLFPAEFRGNSFVPEPSANLIKRNVHVERDGVIDARQAYKSSEFMASTDERFRPVNMYNGPDGALYVVDMYRGVVQHITYVSPWMRRQVVERGLEQPIHQGRIWRIVPEGAARKPAQKMRAATTPQLVAELSHANGWRRDTAQQLLVERADRAAAPLLEQTAKTASAPLARLHALWTLEGLEALTPAMALSALADIDAKVRAAAVRLVEPFAKGDPKVAETLLAMANDKSTDVLLQVILSAGELKNDAGDAVIASLLHRLADNHLARTAALSGLKGRELEFLDRLLSAPAWAEVAPAREAVLGHLARCVLEEKKPERISKLLATAAATRPQGWHQVAMLNGLSGAVPVPPPAPGSLAAQMERTKDAPKIMPQGGFPKGFRVKLPAEPPMLASLVGSTDPGIRDRAVKMASVLSWTGKPGELPEPKPIELSEAQKAHVAAGQQMYALCAACHLPTGQGQEGLAPPLAGSEWVTGPEGRLIRIALQGVGGPMEVAGKHWSLDMPGLAGALSDEQIAQILSYIRREWGHQAPVVETATVTKVREGTKDRGASWTAEELEKLQ